MKYLHNKFLTTALMAAVFVSGFLLFGGSKAFAAFPYDPGDLISDGIFTNTSTMSAASIQTFLNKENSGLKSYSAVENCNPTTPKQPYGFTYYPHCGKKESAATIIYDAAKAYGINPQAILATMQKEQSLVTTPDPTASQINCAMGYNSCSGYVGLFPQIDNGTWQLRTYLQLMNGNNWWSYTPSSYPCANATSLYSTGLYPGRTVRFADPGGKAETITLADSATAALYCYTPYVGPFSLTGYSGSYNFVQSFEQWFGSTVYPWAGEATVTAYSDSARTQVISPSGTFPSGKTIYLTVSAINTGSQTWGSSFTNIGTLGDVASPFQDSSWLSPTRAAHLMQSSVAPTQTGTFEFSITTPNTDGTYTPSFGLVADGKSNGWMKDSATFNFNITVSDPYNASITQLGTYSDSGHTQPTDPGEMTYGQKVYVLVKAKNIGTQTWSNSFTKVAALSSDASDFQDSSWTSATRPAVMLENSVAPGGTGTFEFSMTAPSTDGTHSEAFQLVADGQTSGPMPGATFTFPIHVIDPPASELLSDVVLYKGQELESPNSSYTLAMQGDGNLVIYGGGKAIWASHTAGRGGDLVAMQGDGNLVMYTSAGRAVWASDTAGKGASTLTLDNNGNLAIATNSGGATTWSTNTNYNVVNTPATVTSVGQLVRSTVNNALLSPNAAYLLVMQGDGNLVIYTSAGRAIWASDTAGKGGNSLVMQSDGNLVMYTSTGRAVWASHTAGKGASTLVMQSDGNLVIYNSKGQPTWASHT